MSNLENFQAFFTQNQNKDGRRIKWLGENGKKQLATL